MSHNFPGNPHAEDALSYPGYEDIGPAVMALAFEQRTANLIALLRHLSRTTEAMPEMRYLAEQIVERLGLDQEATQ